MKIAEGISMVTVTRIEPMAVGDQMLQQDRFCGRTDGLWLP